MRRSILVVAVVSLSIFSPHALAQSLSHNTDFKTNTNFDCAAATTQTADSDRLGNATRCYQQGEELFEAGQMVQAAERFRQALQLNPEYADAYAALGRTYFKLRQWQLAIDNLNRAASLNRKQRQASEAALKKDPVAEPKTSPANGPGNSSTANATAKQTKAPAPKLDQVQKNSSVPTTTPPIANRELTNKVNPAPTLKQNTAVLVEVNKPSTPVSSPPAKQTQSTPNSGSIPINAAAANPPLEAPNEATRQSVTGPVSPASKDTTESIPVGSRVAMSVTPPPVTKETTAPAESAIPRSEELPLTKIYRVGANDVLDVRLNTSDQQSTLYTVTATGLLEHPLLNEPLSVAGLTVDEIGTKIEDDLRKRAIFDDPKALVGIRDYASHTVLVSGLVKDAGTKFLRREAIPLYVVVADAQPLPEAARVTVVRNETNQIYEIDLNRAADMNFLVRSGDVITLSPNTTQFIYIGGEIKIPGEKTFRRGLTLMQVILAAGGVDPKAKYAEIARDNGEGFLVPTRFKLKEIGSGKVADPILKPGDRISISR